MNEHYCADCRHFDTMPEGTRGFCRRSAPMPQIAVPHLRTSVEVVWPTVAAEDWCGEFARRLRERPSA